MIATAPEAVKQDRRRSSAARLAGAPGLGTVGLTIAVALALFARAPGLGARSFWLDEALVVHTARAPLSDLVPELSTSPVGFALLERLLLGLPLPAETALRLPSLAAGVGTVLALFALARGLGLGDVAAFGAATLYAVNPTLTYYGREAKPYALDGLAAVVAALLCERVLRRPESRAAWVSFATVGVVLPWLLHPGVFLVLAGDAVLVLALWRQDVRARMVAVGAAQAASVGLLYALVLRVQMSEQLDAYWASAFLPETTSLRFALSWLAARTYELYVLYFEELASPALALTAIGVAALGWQRRWRALGYVGLPWLIVVAASAWHVYPYGGNRVDLLLVPGALLAIGAALGLPGRLGAPTWTACTISGLGLAALAAPAFAATLDRFVVHTYRAEEVGPVVQRMRPLLEPGDTVYIYYAARLAFEWYGRDLRGARVVVGGNHRADVNAYGPEVDGALAGGSRTWFVFSHLYDGEREWMLGRAAAGAREVTRIDDVGASAHLFLR